MTAILRGESTERPGGVSLNGATYRRRFLVRTTSVLDGPFTVVRCEGLPQMLSMYQEPNGEVDPNAFVIDIQAVPRESPTEWFADVDYGPVDQELVGGGGDGNPLNRPIEFGGSLAQHTRLITRAVNADTGNYEAIQNSAGDPYAAQEVDDSRPELEITRNVAGFSLLVLAHYKDAINDDPFLGLFAPGKLKMNYVGFRTMREGGLVYSEVTYHMHYSENWDLELLDEGFYEKVAGTRTRITIPDATGARLIYPTEPTLLDGSGRALPDGRNPEFRRYRGYPRRRFSDILI